MMLWCEQEEQQAIIEGVAHLLTSPGEVLLTKGLSVLAIMCQASSLWLLMACQASLPHLVSDSHQAAGCTTFTAWCKHCMSG